MAEETKEEGKVEAKEMPHVCSVCARPSKTVICHACEDKLRAEALEHKLDAEKHGK
jgi:recombinational DNA repair protein RecR